MPVRLDGGTWLLSVGHWVLPISIDVPTERWEHPTAPHSYDQPPTQEGTGMLAAAVAASTKPPLAGAVDKVRAFFDRNGNACMAMAFYYQEFIMGTAGQGRNEAVSPTGSSGSATRRRDHEQFADHLTEDGPVTRDELLNLLAAAMRESKIAFWSQEFIPARTVHNAQFDLRD